MAAATEPAERPDSPTDAAGTRRRTGRRVRSSVRSSGRAPEPEATASGPEATVGTAQGRELRARGLRTRQRLLDAGTAVFSERGFHAARVDDVVKRAKTSHGTFYLYFSSKEDLFRALAVDVATQMAELAAEFPPIVPGAEGRTAIRTWLERFHDLYERGERSSEPGPRPRSPTPSSAGSAATS